MLNQKMVEVRALSPFVGSYECDLADADSVDDIVVQTSLGLEKKKQARKRYMGKVAVTRFAHDHETATIAQGASLGANIEVMPGGKLITIHADTVKVPEAIALDLVKRGLAERVKA